MLFRKKMDKSCSYCTYGTHLEDEKILCVKKGLCSADSKCFRFRYDPLKRVPVKAKAMDFSSYEQRDFSL